VWVTNQEDHTITVIDTETNKVIATITPGGKKPHNVAFSHDGAYAFVANVGTNDVNMIEKNQKGGRDVSRRDQGPWARREP
jgi:YVTN family beta-propeller protein